MMFLLFGVFLLKESAKKALISFDSLIFKYVFAFVSDVGIYDRVVVQDVIKTMAQVQQLNRQSQRSFKVVVLMEAENLTKDAQHSLRRTMEKYASTCKLILCCESASRIIDPLRSRCMTIRVPAPTNAEVIIINPENNLVFFLFFLICQMRSCIELVCAKERLKLSELWMKLLVEKANGNVRRAICLLEGNVAQQ